jgi:hypothetical protein
MRINAIHSTITNTINNKKQQVTQPSFGEISMFPETHDVRRSLMRLVEIHPEEALKRLKKGDIDAEYINDVFLTVLSQREGQMKLQRIQKEKYSIEATLFDAYNLRESAYASTWITEERRAHYIEKAQAVIDSLARKKIEYSRYDKPDEKRFKMLGKLAKELVKQKNFNPNMRDGYGDTYVERAIKVKDEELALMLIRHPEFKEPHSVCSSVKDELIRLKKKANSWFRF